MSWASGSRIATELWNELRPVIPENLRRSAALKLINTFQENDCDTIVCECEQLMRDAGLWEEWEND